MTVKSLRPSLILAFLAIALTAPLAFAQEADLLVTKSGPVTPDALVWVVIQSVAVFAVTGRTATLTASGGIAGFGRLLFW